MEIWTKKKDDSKSVWDKKHVDKLPFERTFVNFSLLFDIIIMNSNEIEEMYWLVFSKKEEVVLDQQAKRFGYDKFHATVQFIKEGLETSIKEKLPQKFSVTYVGENPQGPSQRMRIAIEFNRIANEIKK